MSVCVVQRKYRIAFKDGDLRRIVVRRGFAILVQREGQIIQYALDFSSRPAVDRLKNRHSKAAPWQRPARQRDWRANDLHAHHTQRHWQRSLSADRDTFHHCPLQHSPQGVHRPGSFQCIVEVTGASSRAVERFVVYLALYLYRTLSHIPFLSLRSVLLLT